MKIPVACASCLKGRQEVQDFQGCGTEGISEVGLNQEEEVGLECFGNTEADPTEVNVEDLTRSPSLEAQSREYLEAQDFRHATCEHILKQLPYKPSKQHRGPAQRVKTTIHSLRPVLAR